MAKRLHRSTPATENHVIHGWEVASSTARLALVPSSSDLGRVARQTDDGSIWVLVSVSPVGWRRVDQSDELYAQPVKTAAMRMAAPALQIPGALQARSIALRAILRNRRIATVDGTVQWWPGGYQMGWFMRDTLFVAGAYPGLFDAVELRRIVDHWAGSYRTSPKPEIAYLWTEGSFAYYLAGINPVYDSAAIFALLIALCIERGDTTVWAAHGAKAVTALDATPRAASGLLNGPSGTTVVGFGFHDGLAFTGGLGAASAQSALAYQRLAVTADASLQAKANLLIAGLQTLRRADGYYNASTDELLPDTVATALVAGFGLCTVEEAVGSGVALANDYRAGKISQYGALRFLPAPNYWTQFRAPAQAAGHFQNGGYVPGPWVWWAARAMLAAGRTTEATSLMQDSVNETLREHRLNALAQGPWEWFNEETAERGYTTYGACGGAFEGVIDPPAQDLVVEVPGTASSSKIFPVPFHRITGIEVMTPTAATATVVVSAAQRKHTINFEQVGNGFLTEKEILRWPLLAGTASLNKAAIKPGYAMGGYLKVALASGSAAQPISVRLLQRQLTTPRFLQPPGQAWTDSFGSNSIASYLRPDENAVWDVNAGRLRQNFSHRNYDACLAPVVATDCDIEAQITTTDGVNVFPGLCLRWKDPYNFIGCRINSTPGQVQVFEIKDGVFSSLGNVAVGAVNNTPLYVKMSLRGTALTVTATATPGSFTATITGAGLCGAAYSANVFGFNNTAYWDDLVITPVATTQRDWITDSETIYTRTGVWSKAASRMLTTDTASVKAAIHPDFSTPNLGVTATFKSASWSAQKAGLCVRAVSASNCIYAVFDGTTVKVYDRNTTDTLIGTGTLAAPLTDGVDATMTLRVKAFTVIVKVGTQVWHFATTRPESNGSAGAFVTTASSSAAEASYGAMRIESYAANWWQPVPVGYVLDGGDRDQAWTSDDVFAGCAAAALVLRDDSGAAVATAADGDDRSLLY